MKSPRIIEIINNPGKIDPEDSAILLKLSKEYPYCQTFRILRAKISYDKDLPDKNRNISTAALYASDRSVLKEFIRSQKPVASPPPKIADDTGKSKPEKETKPEDVTVKKKEKRENKEFITEKSATTETPDKTKPGTDITEKSKDLAEEVLSSLDEYIHTRNEYVTLEEKLEGRLRKKQKRAIKSTKKSFSSKSVKKDDPSGDVKKNEKRKNQIKKTDPLKDRKAEVKKPPADPIEVRSETVRDTVESPPNIPTATPEEEVDDPQLLRDHIKLLDRRAEENYKRLKQHEQLELIEKFIETDLTPRKSLEVEIKEDQEDLSFHSTQFGDDLVTENLANIMVKQNNLENAIDIYKKLIWKFPQKKGYFASQIEKLQTQVNKD